MAHNLTSRNPLNQVSNPKHASPTSRDRRLVDDEEHRILADLYKHSPQTALIFRFALATGMRRGEVLNIEFGHIHKGRSVIHIPFTKTENPRTIPLPQTARDVIFARLGCTGQVLMK
jgi:integrase